MTARHAYGTAVTLESSEDREIVWSCVVDDGVASYTLDLNDVADPELTAGTYEGATGFVAHVAKKLRQSLFDRLDGMPETQPGAGGTRPTAVGDLTVELGFPAANLVAGVNASKLELYFDADPLAGAETVNGRLTLVSVTLVNTNGVWSKLGLCTYGETRGPVAVSAGAVTITGRFQPRWFCVLKASKQDTGTVRGRTSVRSGILADGSGYLITSGRTVSHRTLTWVNLPAVQASPDRIVGRFSAFGASRRLLDMQTLDETLLRGMTGTYSRTSELEEGQYLYAGGWWARFHQLDGAEDTFECYDAWPANTTPKVGEPIRVLSELSALLEEWLRTKYLFVYEIDDATGVPDWIAMAYLPDAQGGEWRPDPVKHGSGFPLFSVGPMNCLLVTYPNLATP